MSIARRLAQVAEQMIAGGVDLIQLRAKTRPAAEIATLAAELHRITLERGVPLIINDHPEIARACLSGRRSCRAGRSSDRRSPGNRRTRLHGGQIDSQRRPGDPRLLRRRGLHRLRTHFRDADKT